jgi:hydrogenase maturation protease
MPPVEGATVQNSKSEYSQGMHSFKDLVFTRGEKVLFYGIGNLGRQDDGLGIRLVTQLQSAFENDELIVKDEIQLSFEMNYQLNIEDALLISDYDVIVFVDALKESTLKEGGVSEPFVFKKIVANKNITFTTHAMNMESILGLCEDMYQKFPQVYVIGIPGSSWEIDDSMTRYAWANLESTFQAILEILKSLNVRGFRIGS